MKVAANHRRGFSLIEIMIVVALMAIVMAIGLPAFTRAFQKEGLRKAMSDMVEACSHARAQAILRGTPMDLVIRAEDGLITVEPTRVSPLEKDAFAAPSQSEAAPPPSSRGKAFSANLPDDVAVELLDVNYYDHMQFAEARVRFFPNGTSDEFAVTLFSTQHERCMIWLDVVTGLADVETDPAKFLGRK